MEEGSTKKNAFNKNVSRSACNMLNKLQSPIVGETRESPKAARLKVVVVSKLQ